MNASQSIQVLEDSSVPGGGYAVIRVIGVRTEPTDLTFYIRRIGYDQANLGYNGWQGPEERLEGFDSAFQPGTLDLMIGPELVDAIDVGTAIEIELPGLGLQQTLYWPDITPSVMGAGAGRRVAFSGRQAAPAARSQTPPPVQASPPAAPPDSGPDTDATMVGGRPLPPPPPPPPEEEATVILSEEELSGFAERDERFNFGSEEDEEAPGPADRGGRKGKPPGQTPRLSPALLAGGIVALVLVLGGLAYFVLGESLGLREAQVAEEDGGPRPPDGGTDRVPPVEQAEPPDTVREPVITPPPPPPDPTFEERQRLPEPPTEVAMQRQPRQPQTPPTTFVRSIVRGDPASSELYELAQYHLGQGDVDVALLLLEQAELQGYGPAMTAIGRMYDPVHFAPSGSAFTHANPERAIQYYREAQQAGDPAAEDALAELRDWLETQAADGDPTAEELLRDYWQS